MILIHSFNRYIFSVYYVPSTVPSSVDITVNKTSNVLMFLSHTAVCQVRTYLAKFTKLGLWILLRAE